MSQHTISHWEIILHCLFCSCRSYTESTKCPFSRLYFQEFYIATTFEMLRYIVFFQSKVHIMLVMQQNNDNISLPNEGREILGFLSCDGTHSMWWHPSDLCILPIDTWGNGNWLDDADAPIACCAVGRNVPCLWPRHLMFSSNIHETVEDCLFMIADRKQGHQQKQ